MEREILNSIIVRLEQKKERLLRSADSLSFKRTQYSTVKNALDEHAYPILFGLRRTGKTTILIQLMQEFKNSIYITCRDSYISLLSRIELVDLIECLYDVGKRYIFLDEVQMFPFWSELIVEIYDSFPEIKIVATGSSSLNLEMRETGLDRTRKINIHTLSFGEYLSLTGKTKNKENFEHFLGRGGFPKYAINEEENFDIQRAEILDEVINNDIPAEDHSIEPTLLSRLLFEIARHTNGEINVNEICNKIAENFRARDVQKYLEALEKSKVIKIINRIDENGIQPLRKKFKVYINPHLHLWMLDTPFENLDPTFKGHIVESYWLFWAMSLNHYDKQFYYIKGKDNLEVDFVSINPSSVKPFFKTLHELKYSSRRTHDLSYLKTINAVNKIVWSIDGEDIDSITGKSILDTFDRAL